VTVDRMTNHPTATKNLADGLAFDADAKTALYKAACTSLVGENSYYQSGNERNAEMLASLYKVASEDPEWVLRLASYVRNEMNLRSASTMILCEASRMPSCRPFVRKWTPHILKRADELKEALAYMLNNYGRPVPACLRKGIADAFHNFDEYQFLKYDQVRSNGSVTMMDVLRMCHPVPDCKSQEAMFGYLCNKEVPDKLLPKAVAQKKFNDLKTWGSKAQKLISDGHVNWDMAVSQFGNRKEIWNSLNLPFMAALRNLRNMAKSGADMTKVLGMLKDPIAVKRSKQLPFRFYMADKMMKDVCDPFVASEVRKALAIALDHSTANVPQLPGKTLVMVDVSGSMRQPVSGKSKMQCDEIAMLLGSVCARGMDNVIVSLFATDFEFVDLSGMNVVAGLKFLKEKQVGQATYAHKTIDHIVKKNVYVDRIIVLSDFQCYGDSLMQTGWYTKEPNQFPTSIAKYKREINKDVKVISIDLTGNTTLMLPKDEPNVAMVAGWSERIFDFIEKFESGSGDALGAISEYEAPAIRSPKWANEKPIR